MITELLKQIYRERTIGQIKFLLKWLFPELKAVQNITDTQAYIVKRIAFVESKRISISAYTRYGKSQTVANALTLYILLNKNKKIKFVAPTDEQANIIKNYMSELLLSSREDILLKLCDFELTHKRDRLKAEASQRRMTFKNGCEYSLVTAHGKGFSAMGKGADLCVIDEASLISRESYAKLVRMLGDDPENSVLIELYNPWDRDTKAYDHSISPRFERIQVSYEVGLKEGRITQGFIDEMREELTPMEFKVLYESEFPDEAEDSLHKLSYIEFAEKQDFNFIKEIELLNEKLDNFSKYTEFEITKAKRELSKYSFRVSCDPADKGLDFTVYNWGIVKEDRYFEIIGVESEAKSENMRIVGKLMQLYDKCCPKRIKAKIQLDKIGIGVGVESRLKEIVFERDLSEDLIIVGCHFGEKAIKSEEFQNKKAENNFRLRDLLSSKQISFKYIIKNKDYHKIKSELMSIKWEMNSSQKKRIIDPDKSPDFSEALVFFVWKDNKTLVYDFI